MMSLKSSPQVMGIINVSSESFCSLGRIQTVDQALYRAEVMVSEGAQIIDVGGEPTNPNTAIHTDRDIELARVIPVIDAIARRFPICVSVDTSKPAVMKAAAEHGARFINDVRALQYDGALAMAAQLNLPVCLMHMLYPFGIDKPSLDPSFHVDPIASIRTFFSQRIAACRDAGIARDKLYLDVGFGGGAFGKQTLESLYLLHNLPAFADFQLPLLVGLSRKRLVADCIEAHLSEIPSAAPRESLDEPARVSGSVALATLAVYQGASIIRAHDVKETVDAVAIAWACRNARARTELG